MEDSLFWKLHNVSIGEFVAFLLQGSFVAKKLIFIVVGYFNVFLFDFFDNFSVLNLIFWLESNGTKN